MYKRIVKSLSVIFTAFIITVAGGVSALAYTSSTQVIPSYNNEEAENGYMVVGIDGDYHVDIKAAIDRVNAIRLEACKEGVPNPSNPSKKLTVNDYVPIKWSAGLEKVARVRAAEASIRIAHTRPNDKGPFSIGSSDVFNCGEVLAWNWSDTMVSGINQFYGEKADWVAQNSNAVTGHYESMINPSNTYMGLGCFTSDNSIYHNCVAGRFGNYDYGNNVDGTYGKEISGCIVSIIVNKNYLSSPTLNLVEGSNSIIVGKQARFELRATSKIEGGSAKVLLFDGVKWTSSNTNIATVDSYGKVVGKNKGTVVITGTCGDFKASAEITVGENLSDNITLSPTSFTYDGKEHKPLVTVKDSNDNVIAPSEYNVKYSNNINVGTAKVNITFKGDTYAGTVSKTFKINKANNKITGTASYTKTASSKNQSFKLNAKATGGKITYKSGNNKIKVDSTGKVTIEKNYSGKAVITVTAGNNNYKTATRKITILVKPAATTIKSVRNSVTKTVKKGRITVAWNKISYATGYQIQYSTNSAFKSGNKTVTVKGASTVSKAITGLKSATKYYVRIRTYKKVGSSTYYSAWSKARSVTTK